MEKSKIVCFLLIALMVALCGCGAEIPSRTASPSSEIEEKKVFAEPSESDMPPSDSEKSQDSGQETSGIALSDHDIGDEITPYQFLYLLSGNAEELSFTYTMLHPGADNPQTVYFQRLGDTCVACFTARDMNGNFVSVRELETGGKVHYIMDDSRMIKTYLAPAEDFLLYQMLEAAKTMPESAISEDGFMLYEHYLPIAQDETLRYRYSFFMQDDALKKLMVTLGDVEETIYTFSEFQQDITDEATFTYPEGYVEEVFDYGYTGEHMPPWWEIGNDE